MRMPTHTFTAAVDSRLYYPTPNEKLPQIVFIKRKQEETPHLMRLLWSRNPRYIEAIRWLALDGMPETEYAAHVRRAQLFLNLSHAEGWPCSMLEAMRPGTLVAGWNSVGGKRELIGTGPNQNGIFVENLDYPELARAIQPVLEGILAATSPPGTPSAPMPSPCPNITPKRRRNSRCSPSGTAFWANEPTSRLLPSLSLALPIHSIASIQARQHSPFNQ